MPDPRGRPKGLGRLIVGAKAPLAVELGGDRLRRRAIAPESPKKTPNRPKKAVPGQNSAPSDPRFGTWQEPGLTRGERNARWIEHYCRVPEGKLVGQRVVLTAEQRSWLHQIYDSATRMFILSMARKNAKTAFSAFLLLLHLVGPEATPNSQLYSAAQSREQAAILFGLAEKMVRLNPDLTAHVTVRETAKQLVCGALGTIYRALSAEASTAYGLSPVFTVHDELGQVKGPRSDLFEALETASAAHDMPLSVIISTQAPTDADLLSTLIDEALTGEDPTRKVVLYTAPVELDPFAPSTIKLANPHFDVFMNRDEVIRQAQTARRMPSRENSYRNLILNQRVEARSPFVSRAVWLENAAPPDSLEGLTVYGGLDLASVADLTALVLVSSEGDVVPTFWLPDEGLEEKSRHDKVPYDQWRDEGLLETTPGRAVEYEFVAYRLREIFDRFDVAAIAFDRALMKHLTPWLARAGFDEQELERFVDFGQGFMSMSPAIRELESRLLARKLRHGDHKVLTMCAKNCVTVQDPAGNRKFVKSKATGRIDGMVALAMAVGVMPEVDTDVGDIMDFLREPVTG